VTPDLLELAENPAFYTPLTPRMERVLDERFCLLVFVGRSYAEAHRLRFSPESVENGVADVRRAALAHGCESVLWWVGEEATPRDLGERLTTLGLEPKADTPSLTSMVLTHEPSGRSVVEARAVESAAEYLAAHEVDWECWNAPEERRNALREDIDARWEEMRNSEHLRTYVAFSNGEAVGFGRAVFVEGAAYLMGGSTLPHARGRGVYRALVHARWRDAQARGASILFVQAVEESRPILERLGFDPLGSIRLFVDDLRK
jgi:GNAT superfamily N-acetyltransferase